MSEARQFEGDRLIVATHNAGKLKEIRALLAPFSVDVVSAGELGLPEPEETETTFEGNARIKAHAAAKASGLPALADDSGLEVDALDGAPGVYTADWAETPGEPERGRDFDMAMRKTHDALTARGASEPWTARFVSVLALAWPDGEDRVFRGTVEGRLTWPTRGDIGFGYDPMFVRDGQSQGAEKTFAEMQPDEKAAHSHRTAAFEQFVAGCFGKGA